MRAVQILMDERLLEAVDREAQRRRSDRSKLVRSALEAFLAGERRRQLEEQHRRAYERAPQSREEYEPWERIQAWPGD